MSEELAQRSLEEPQRRFTLAFLNRDLEGIYRRNTAAEVRRWYRFAGVLCLIGFAASWFADPLIMGTPENGEVLRRLRLTVALPMLAPTVAFGWAPTRWFERAWAQVGLAGIAIMLVVPTIAIIVAPEPSQVQNGTAAISMISVLIAGLVVLPVRFVNALAAALTITLPVLIIGTRYAAYNDPVAVSFWFVWGAAIAVLGAWLTEQRHRRAFAASYRLDQERARSEHLLRNVLPAPIAERMKQGASRIVDSFDQVSVLFADIAEFTPLAATLTPEQVIELLNQIFTRFDELAARHRLEKIKTIGDAYMVVAGVPEPRRDHAQAAADIALDMRAAIAEMSRTTGYSLRVRIGVCSGPAVAGVIGIQKFAYDLWGDTVNAASRMESHGAPGEIHVAESTYQLLREHYTFVDRGVIDVKGKGPMQTYFLQGRRTTATGA